VTLRGILVVRFPEMAPWSYFRSITRNSYGTYQTVRCYNNSLSRVKDEVAPLQYGGTKAVVSSHSIFP